jgi:DNA-directed RNA polymerase subunit omega
VLPLSSHGAFGTGRLHKAAKRKENSIMAMSHPNYVELMKVVNKDVEEGEAPVINSRYSIVMATAKRARQLVNGAEPLVEADPKTKPLSVAVDELYKGKIQILGTSGDDDDLSALSLTGGTAVISEADLEEGEPDDSESGEKSIDESAEEEDEAEPVEEN